MFSIRGDVKDYDWGILDGLTPWTQDSSGAPQAELWFGVHPSGPSPIDAVVHEGETASPTENLADHLTREQAPVLAKILAAGRPLSVQVHPNAREAKRAAPRRGPRRGAPGTGRGGAGQYLLR